ncbi:cupin domain-containing protein [Sinisalibacter aestuarii]|uniref:Cupin type-2 domain-containing protein n=1 Tax=Sinisalibacter aestuarii TaxID=2949426 RepID=A0ABQ5LT81_9RHOB|nr:cupin domain-containing protein [Sinisalibacter aestuarii]GKY87958.1 hypothetical protein STA1M1_18270 [Sinisalibacter aestuarii]
MKQILNLDDASLATVGNGGTFMAEFASLTQALGAKKLGVSLAVVPPGKRAWPKHAHHVNEEMMLILDGEGRYHCGDESAPVRTGDLISAPPGDGSTAHQLENTSDAPLRYLTFSTRLEPELVEYPNSGKIGITSYAGHDGPHVRLLVPAGESLGYWDGEDD